MVWFPSMSNDNAMSFYALTSAFVRKALMLSFGSGYKTGKSPRACTPASSVVSSGIIEQRSVAGLSFGVIAWSAWIRYEHGANLQIEKHLAGSAVSRPILLGSSGSSSGSTGAGCSAAMKMVGHKTQSIYSRCAIADEGLLKDAALKLTNLHAAAKVRSIKN